MTECMERLYRLMQLSSSSVLREQLVIDGGCNLGQFASRAVKHLDKARIISFEPDPDSYDNAKKNWKISIK
jgi:predicted RNA methylase